MWGLGREPVRRARRARIAVVGLGVAGGIAGTREFHEPGESEHEAEGALGPAGAPVTVEVPR